mmetsp:Transcript_97118/g.283800  ORF Transcript_97118/g.283800 Transcript_97118/m.283800 type:complete len:265 (-) Transcript_97118:756-1550(-)
MGDALITSRGRKVPPLRHANAQASSHDLGGKVRRAGAPLPRRPRPRAAALASNLDLGAGGAPLPQREGHGGALARGTAGPGGPGELLQLLALSALQASPDRLQLPPAANVLKHHLAVVRVLVGPVDDHRPAGDVSTGDLLELDVEDAGLRARDLLEALKDAVEVSVAASAAVAHHHHGRSAAAGRAANTIVCQRRHPVALPAVLAPPKSWVGVSNGAVEARAQIGGQDWVSEAVHGCVCILALGADQAFLGGPHRHGALEYWCR